MLQTTLPPSSLSLGSETFFRSETPSQEISSNELALKWRRGDQDAANELYRRYFQQVTRLVSGRLNRKFQGRLSSDDVVQSVFKSAFRMTRDDPQEFSTDDAFRRWLVTVALNKVFKRIQYETAQKRTPDREQSANASEGFTAYVATCLSEAPRQDEALAVAELWERVAAVVTDNQKELMQLRLQGMSQREIADQMRVDTRTIRRWSRDLEQRAYGVLKEELSLQDK